MSDTARWLIGAWVFLTLLVYMGGCWVSRAIPLEPAQPVCDTCIEVDDWLRGQPSDYDGEPDSDAVIRERFNALITSNGYAGERR